MAALTYNEIISQIRIAGQASTADEIRVRLQLVEQRILSEIKDENSAPIKAASNTAALDAAIQRLEKVSQRNNISVQLTEDLKTVLGDLNRMYQLTRWGQK